MNKGNRVKAEALGMSHGTAANRLRKMILFSLVCRLELNTCYQCGSEILSVDDLSIEHKEPWLRADDPVESFFDLDNIAFSHLSCNVAAASRPNKRYKTSRDRELAANVRRVERWRDRPITERQKQRREKYRQYGC